MVKRYLLFFTMLLVGSVVALAEQSIIGKVVDSKSKEPLRGVTIRILGTKLGAVTKNDGTYQVRLLTAGTYDVKATYTGYKSAQKKVEVKTGETETENFELDQDYALLEETVVVGYGTTQKREVTGAYTTIKNEQLTKQATPSLESTLQGKVSGVQIVQSNGMAGTAATVRVRGVGSITANTQPLYVVDGIPITTGEFGANIASDVNALSFLNPNDIETIEVLKDAAATAIYGSRGANGVVLITTKRGKEGATKISAGYYNGFVNEANRIKLVDRNTWIDLYYEARRNDVIDSVSKLAANRGKSWSEVSSLIAGDQNAQNAINNTLLPQGFNRQTAANNNWLDQVLRTGTTSEAYFSVSGGVSNAKYYFNTTYRNEKGFIVGNDYDRFSNRLTLDAKATEWLDVGVTLGLTREQNNRVNSAWAGGLGTAQSSALDIYPVRDSTGEYWRPQTGLNPLADLENRRFFATTWRTLANAYAQINVMENLYVRSTVGIDLLNLREERFTPALLTVDPIAEDRRVQITNWTSSTYADYVPLETEDHTIQLTAGIEVQRTEQEDVGTTGQNFPSTYFTTPQNASVRNGFSFQTQNGFVSYFGRANYKLLDRFLFSASIRTDGSSRFGANNRYGTFPAVSAAWILSNESFLKGNETVTFAKLRASYGLSGNAAIGDFAWQGTYTAGANYNNQPGTRPNQLPNSDLTWENSRQLDLALDFGLLNDRITGSINYYNRISQNMLLNERVPASSGFATVIKNIGEMSNTGVEFNVKSYNISSADFEWSTDFNITFNTNKILNLGSTTSPDAIDLGFGETRAIVNYPFAVYNLVRYAGTDAKTGAPVYFRPKSKTVQINGKDSVMLMNGLYGNPIELEEARDSLGNPLSWNATWRVPTGKNYPDAFGGITNSFKFMGFDFSFLLNFQLGNNIYDDAGKRLVGNMGFAWQQMEVSLDRWQNEGDVTNVPRLTLTGNRDINTDRFLYNADFLRLRNVTLGYTFSSSMISSLGLTSLRVYTTMQNLLTFTSFPGWDPEVVRDHDNDQQRNGNQGVTYLTPPQARSFIFGLNLEI